jgi:competence protein ComEA
MNLNQQYQKALIFVIVVILAGSGYWILKQFRPALFLGEPDLVVPSENRDRSETKVSVKDPLPAPQPEILVHVAGAVVLPGVYRFPPDAHVIDTIEKAGGTTESADVHRLNLAAKIHDGQQIYVPSISQATSSAADVPHRLPQPSVFAPTGAEESLIDLNTAMSEQLQSLPRVGPVTAKRIIEYREISGRFSSIQDLTKVKGIGEKTLERIRHLVVVY